MNEIVPPKLNKETGLLSLIFSRKNLLILLGIGVSTLIWTGGYSLTTDTKIILELVLGFCLIPFLFDFNGRALHKYFLDFLKFVALKKEVNISINIEENGLINLGEGKYSKVFRIEPVNLTMSSDEQISEFKQYVSQALFSLRNPIQILTIQRQSDTNIDENLESENPVIKACFEKYKGELLKLPPTLEKDYFLILTSLSNTLLGAEQKIAEDENSFCKLLEQSGVRIQRVEHDDLAKVLNQLLLKTNA